MVNSLYENDFQLWINSTIQQLKNGEFDSIDLENLIEELTSLGKSEKNALKSNLMILLAHLLKLQVQSDAPETMKISWYNSVIEHRQRVLTHLEDTPSLKNFIPEAMDKAYPQARNLAIKEGKFAALGVRIPGEGEYPLTCPFSIQQILDEDFYG
ncbi:conserved hypothetical protein [Planktothrix serta PCC 8927]|uniref:DUF29 domain-containing protein n=1 Tax=Planktothrix serta PCC 8927 TaxID=671068 RepID=A0A7Z9BWI5_9CYAN|nr:DUF29 domain-containing protein [Planktothrix serta]VXD23923.1 conserved hypothetical protein [Planktothrix serta PCC 8927]